MTAAPARPALDATDRLAILLTLGYFGLHVLSRLLAGPALELDEAEQTLWAQHLQAGYGAQPPLYTWLQWLMFQLTGVSVPGLTLLKNGLLALTYLFCYRAARLLLPAPLALHAAASLLLLPQIAWEAQRDLSHTVLVTCLAALTLLLVLRMRHQARPWHYLALGVTVGLGLLAKYNYALFAAALFGATLARPATRAPWRSPWIFASLLGALLVPLPHLAWLATHWHLASAGTLAKLGASAAPDLFDATRWLTGLAQLGRATLATLAPALLAFALLFGRDAWRGPAHDADAWRLGRDLLLLLLLACLALIALAGVAEFKDRWLTPLLFWVPPMLLNGAGLAPAHPGLPGLRRLLVAGAVLVLLLINLRAPFDGWRGQPDELNAPAAALATALRAAGFDGHGRILATRQALGGLLRIQFPAARVQIQREPRAIALDSDPAPLLIIAADGERDAVRARLPATAAATPIRVIELPYRFARAGQPPARFAFALCDFPADPHRL